MFSKNALDIKKLVTTSIFLSLSILFVYLQIPVYGFLNFDFSTVPLLLCCWFVGYWYSFTIALIFPWFAMLSYLSADITGCLILITLNLLLITTYQLIKNLKLNVYIEITLVTLITTVIITFMNIFFFTPWYYSFDYSYVLDSFWYYFWMYIGFNFCKISINYSIFKILTSNKKLWKEISS